MSKLGGNSLTLAEVIDHAIDERLADVHTAIPARVVSYDATKQMVSVQILVKTRDEAADGTVEARSIAVVHGVPIVWAIPTATTPVPVGSFALLMHAERSVDRWLAGAGEEVDPADVRVFHLSDGFALLGLRPFGAPLSNVPTDSTCVSGPVLLGGFDATAFAADASKVDAALGALKAAVSASADFNAFKIAAAGLFAGSTACALVKVK